MTKNKDKSNTRLGKLKIIWYFLRAYKGLLALLLIISGSIGFLEAANIAILYLILSFGLETGTEQHYYITTIFERFLNIFPIEDKFIAACILFIIVTMCISAMKYINLALRVYLSNSILKKTKKEMFEKYMQADYQYYIENKQGDMIYNIRTAPSFLYTVFNALGFIISDGLMAISIFFLLFTLSWQGTILMILVGISYYGFTRYVGNKVSYTTGKVLVETSQEETVTVNEVITGIRTVKVFSAEDKWKEKYDDVMIRYLNGYRKQQIWNQTPMIILEVVMFISVGVMAILLKITYPFNFESLLPIFGAFGFAVFRLLPRFTSFGNIRMQIMSSMPNLELTHAILTEKSRLIEDGTQEMKTIKKGILFDNVHFSYKGKTELLKGVTVDFKKGQTTAIVGTSGSGKTTIINLLLRLFEPSRGKITVDGVDIKNYKISSWLDRIGFVSQETFIYNATVRENINFGGDYSDEDIENAAKIANAYKFIDNMPDKYNTLVGDRGMTLSGGQMQRIAIARAVIRDPEIVILDEATSALDSVSEKLVQKAITRISRDRTVIIIAHRLSTIIDADKIIVLHGGHVVEKGKHKELLRKKGIYWDLYNTQLSEEE